LQRLQELSGLFGIAGHEDPVISYMRQHLEQGADAVTVDWMGNVIARIGPEKAKPRIMIFAHMDELGFLVRGMAPGGFLRVERLGGIPEKSLQAQRVVVHGQHGPLPGIIGTKAHHLTPTEERRQGLPVAELYVDVGAGRRSQAEAMGIRVGTPVTYAPAFHLLGDGLVSCKTLDNRGGCWILLRLLDRLGQQPVPPTVYLVATVQEEFHLQGAMPVVAALQPDLAICLDIALATDTPDLDDRGEVMVGGGPVIQTLTFHGRGTLAGLIPNPKLVGFVAATAEQAGIPYQYGVTVGALTDASYLHLAGRGIPAIDLGFPTRYTHTPVETCSLADLDRLLELLHALLRSLHPLPDLARG
jgi:putative aminopeptidase